MPLYGENLEDTEVVKYLLIREEDLLALKEARRRLIAKEEPAKTVPDPVRQPIPVFDPVYTDHSKRDLEEVENIILEMLPHSCNRRGTLVLKALKSTGKFGINPKTGAIIISEKEISGSNCSDLLRALTIHKPVPDENMPALKGMLEMIDLLSESLIGKAFSDGYDGSVWSSFL